MKQAMPKSIKTPFFMSYESSLTTLFPFTSLCRIPTENIWCSASPTVGIIENSLSVVGQSPLYKIGENIFIN